MMKTFLFLLFSHLITTTNGQPEIGSPWSMFGGSPSHGGVGLSKSSIPSVGATILWTYQTFGAVKSSPAIAADGTLYVGSFDMHLYALNSNDGSFLWTHKARAEVDSSPAIGLGGVVFVGASFPDNQVRAINASGGLLWSFQTQSSVISSPILANNTVYVGSDDSMLYALSAASGEISWAFITDGPVEAAPALTPDGSVVFAVTTKGTMFAINAYTGGELWHLTAAGPLKAAPTVTDDGIFVLVGEAAGIKSSLLCVFAANGTVFWHTAVYASVEAPVALDGNGRVIVGTNFPANALFAFSLSSGGASLWNVTIGSVALSAPAIDRGSNTVVIGSWDQSVYAINTVTGAIIWRIPLTGFTTSSPALANGKVFIGCGDGTIVAISMPSSTPWKPSMAMIVIGVSIAVAVVIGGAVFIWRRRQIKIPVVADIDDLAYQGLN